MQSSYPPRDPPQTIKKQKRLRNAIPSIFSPIMDFSNVTAVAKANIYFDGNVVSHSIIFSDGSKKTLGIIYPGSYHFGTEAAERMEIIDGSCNVALDGADAKTEYAAGSHFDVPAHSGFTIEVANPVCQYVCSFLS